MFNESTTTEATGGRGAEPQAKLGAAAAPQTSARPAPDPELSERAERRRFSAQYKLEVLRKADACRPGEVGALLRSEGLYSSHLTRWRKLQREGSLGALSRKRGRKGQDPLVRENAQLRHRAEHAEAELAKARKVIEVQGNVLALSEQLLGTGGAIVDGSTGR
jgi:transposase